MPRTEATSDEVSQVDICLGLGFLICNDHKGPTVTAQVKRYITRDRKVHEVSLAVDSTTLNTLIPGFYRGLQEVVPAVVVPVLQNVLKLS